MSPLPCLMTTSGGACSHPQWLQERSPSHQRAGLAAYRRYAKWRLKCASKGADWVAGFLAGGATMDEPSQQVDTGISRRTVLKRVGAGAVIAWTAPVLMSVQNRAWAASPPGCGDRCNGIGCGNNPICDEPNDCSLQCRADGSECVCLAQFGNCLVCASDADCAQFGEGYVCTQNCICGPTGCAAPCGASESGRAPRGVKRYHL